MAAAGIANAAGLNTDVTGALPIKTATITAEKLAATPLSDLEIQSGKHDKKFTIALDDGKYIKGAVIFGDCGYQFTGSTLGDAFGINNTDTKANAYNFNILFSFEYTQNATFNLSLESNQVGACFKCIVKYAECDGEDFYGALAKKNYSNIVGDPGNAMYYGEYGYAYDTYGAEAVERSVNLPKEDTTLAVLQFTHRNGDYIAAGNYARCTIQSIVFNYSCK